MAQDQVSVEITIEEKQALRALTQLSRGMDNFEKGSTKAVKKTDSAMASFKGNLLATAASGAFRAIASGLGQLVTGSLEAAASAEKINTQLEVLTGSQEKAAALYKELTDFSASTPFQLQGIAEASAQLLSFGFEADTVTGRIEKIGEVAAGSGSDLKEVALIYGQVAAAGKLTGERLLQLQERAIPIGSALAKSLGVAESEVKDLVSSGVVGFREFEQAFNSLSQSGGLFEGAIEKQAATLTGSISTLNDNFDIFQQKLGALISPGAVTSVAALTEALQSLGDALDDDTQGLGLFASIVGETTQNVIGFAAEALKVETPLDQVNNKITELVDKQIELQEKTKEAKDALGDFGGVFDFVREKAINFNEKQFQEIEAELARLEKTRQNIIKAQAVEASRESQGSEGGESPRVKKEQETNQKILAERAKLQLGLDQSRVQSEQMEAERKLAEDQLSVDQREQEIQNISNFEQQKADLVLQAELDKASKIRDAKTRELAEANAFSKRSISIAQAEANEKARLAELEKQTFQVRTQAAQNFLAAGISLAKQGSREQKALQTAQALVSTYTAANQALAAPPGPPVTFALAASVVAQGLANVARINKQSFQTGGVVGGFAGATNGADNTTANVRTGEMVLNGQQQRRLFDIANEASKQTGGGEMIQVTSIVELDGREIARSVREQQRQGFTV